MIDMTDNEEVGGIPKMNKKRTRDMRETFYRLGYTAANLEKKREQLKTDGEFSIIQKAQLSDAAQRLQDLMAEVKRVTADAKASLAAPDLLGSMGGPSGPDLSGIIGGGTPGGIPLDGGGAPPDMSGMQGGMPPDSGGGAPMPVDLMGGQSMTAGPSL